MHFFVAETDSLEGKDGAKKRVMDRAALLKGRPRQYNEEVSIVFFIVFTAF